LFSRRLSGDFAREWCKRNAERACGIAFQEVPSVHDFGGYGKAQRTTSVM
jgi:hypothetical protein